MSDSFTYSIARPRMIVKGSKGSGCTWEADVRPVGTSRCFVDVQVCYDGAWMRRSGTMDADLTYDDASAARVVEFVNSQVV